MAVDPLVLLPGRLCDARLFQPQISELGRLTGVSVGDLTRSDTFEQLARDVLAEAPARFALAGLSFGGIVALEIVRQTPQRVSRLALLDANPGGNTPRHIEDFEAQIRQAEAGSEDFLKLTTEFFYPQMAHPARLADAALRDEVIAMALAVGPAAFVRQNQALKKRSPRWQDLPQISCPALILGGRQDTVCPPAIQAEMAALIPGARLAIIEECGHLSTLEQPQRVTEALKEWLLAGA
jgi:pimeloyl-ACP methyl ester carboxylesterase